jgi:hypothetical protein
MEHLTQPDINFGSSLNDKSICILTATICCTVNYQNSVIYRKSLNKTRFCNSTADTSSPPNNFIISLLLYMKGNNYVMMFFLQHFHKLLVTVVSLSYLQIIGFLYKISILHTKSTLLLK